MLLGKRPRPPMTRSTSMRGITTVDLSNVEAPEPSDSSTSCMNSSGGGDHLMMRETTSHFLRICGLCQRRLSPGRDIFMYRGDTAFCSQECREQQMKQDERKEKYSSMPTTTAATTSKASGKGAQ